ncbi:hypothetical protein SRABI106_03537 [Rahnella aquatilis]|nr:hypothetical protein SRABI106_03537 [Rahnella aquatilis]
MDFVNADGVCRTDDGRNVMWFMHLFHTDRQVWLSGRKHFADAGITFWGHNNQFRLRVTLMTSGMIRILRMIFAR